MWMKFNKKEYRQKKQRKEKKKNLSEQRDVY
jgi:hypothetical protein